MKLTKKLAITAGLFLQIAGSLYGSAAWQDAFLAFGGGTDAAVAANTVISGATKMTYQNAFNTARPLGTPEAFAVAAFVCTEKLKIKLLAGKAKGYLNSDVTAAANAIIENAPSRAVVAQPVVSTPTTQQPATGWGWFGGSSAQPAQITPANVQAAVQEQQKADLALAAANNDALAKIVASGKSGLGLYTAFIDYIFSVLQQAVNSIADASTQQQVLSYMQGKFANMKASVAANNYKSRTLGRLNSKPAKKSGKKNKNF